MHFNQALPLLVGQQNASQRVAAFGLTGWGCSPKVGELPERVRGMNRTYNFQVSTLVCSYLLRYARPPTLGGQPRPACLSFDYSIDSFILRFSAFGPSGWGCSPKVGELPERVRGMNRPKRAYGMKLPRMLIPPPLRSSSYLRRTAPSGCLLPFGLLSAVGQAGEGRIKTNEGEMLAGPRFVVSLQRVAAKERERCRQLILSQAMSQAESLLHTDTT